jgi:hypothetical protein
VNPAAVAPGPLRGGLLHSGHAAASGEAGLPRLLPPAALPAPGQGADLQAHLRRHGQPRHRGSALTDQAEAAGLTGRGGAAFPVARKLRAVASARGVPVVVGNGAEGEPGSSKDAALLWLAPHLVLDGLQLAAEAICTCPRPQQRPAAPTCQAACGLPSRSARRRELTGSACSSPRRRRGSWPGRRVRWCPG